MISKIRITVQSIGKKVFHPLVLIKRVRTLFNYACSRLIKKPIPTFVARVREIAENLINIAANEK